MTEKVLTEEKHLSLHPLRLNGERECFITVFHDRENKVDIAIGAATPQALVEAYERFTGLKADPDMVSPALFRKSRPGEVTPGEGFAYFRKRVLRALYG